MKSKILIIALAILLVLLPLPVLAQSVVEGDIGTTTPWLSFGSDTFDTYGLLWVFYLDNEIAEDDPIRWRTSDDYGATWSDSQTEFIACSTTGHRWDIWFDGTYVHCVYGISIGGIKTYYQRGMPNADGTITWDTAQNIGLMTSELTIAADTSGYAWITYLDAGGDDIWVRKNANNDGTWSTEREDEITAGAYESTQGKILPLTNQKMVVIFRDWNFGTLCARRWTTVAWGTIAENTELVSSIKYWDVVVQDDDVHATYLDVGENVKYDKWQYSNNSWGVPVELADFNNGDDLFPAILIFPTNNDLYVFHEGLTGTWGITDHMYYHRYNSATSTWNAAVDWIDETIMDGIQGVQHMVQEYPNPGMVGLYYVAGSGSPYILKYKEVQEGANVTTLSPTGVTATYATLRGEITGLGTGAITDRGFYINTAGNMTGATLVSDSDECPCGVGVFSEVATGLEPDTIYYYTAAAVSYDETIYGEWVGFITAQPSYADDETTDDGLTPPNPPEPGDWIRPPKDWGDFNGIPWTFIAFLLIAGVMVLVGLLTTSATRSVIVLFGVLGFLMAFFCIFPRGGYLDWWVMFPYIIVGWALIRRDQLAPLG